MSEQTVETPVVDITDSVANSEVPQEFTEVEGTPPEGIPLSKREIEMNMRRALEERKRVIKENKLMIDDMQLEVSYRKAQADVLRYRFELMDFYLKNLELEPQYLAAVEKSRLASQEAENKEFKLD